MRFEMNFASDDAAEFSGFATAIAAFLNTWNSDRPAGPPAMPPAPETRLAIASSPNGAGVINSVSPPLPSDELKQPAAITPEVASPSETTGSGVELEKPKRIRRTRAEMDAARGATAEQGASREIPGVKSNGTRLPAVNGAGASGVSTALQARTYTIDEVKAAYSRMCMKLGDKSRGVAAKILLDLNVAKFSELPAEKFAAAVEVFERYTTQPLETAEKISDEIAF